MAAPLNCPRCSALLPTDPGIAAATSACPQCATRLQLAVFPAFGTGVTPGRAAEAALVAGEAICFFHPTKKAVVPCDRCGRFLCALCDLPMGSAHFCPPCLEAGSRGGAVDQLETRRTRHDTIAWYILLLGILTCGFAMPLTGPIAAGWAWRHLKSSPSRVDNSLLRLRLAMAAGLLEFTAGIAWWIFQLRNPTGQ